jgi:hypothetical protein
MMFDVMVCARLHCYNPKTVTCIVIAMRTIYVI